MRRQRAERRGTRVGASATALALAVVVVAGCSDDSATSSDGAASASTEPVCEVYDSIEWDAPPVTADDSNDDASLKFAQQLRDEQALVDAADGSMNTAAQKVLDSGAKYRLRYLEERRSAGGGDGLTERAYRSGFSDSRSYVESLVFDDPTAIATDHRALTSQLAATCQDLHLLAPTELDADVAPAGEILAVKLNSNEIHRFSTSGDDLGQVPVPAVVQAPIQYTTLSPDGSRLAFLAGSEHEKLLWVVDLATGAAESTTPPACMDWNDDGADFWALVDSPPNQYVARIEMDGTFDAATRLGVDGCPWRFTSGNLVMDTVPVDGAPVQIDVLPKDGAPPTTLVANRCNLVDPRISPDTSRLTITAGCPTDADAGVFVVDADGENLRQVFSGIAAAATWSPDGKWLTFATYSADHPADIDQLQVAISTADGSTTGAVTPPGYSWPIWVTS
ncbi:hypothetical protein BH10ACT3_BH10ACT3_01190 [soil metagenome]